MEPTLPADDIQLIVPSFTLCLFGLFGLALHFLGKWGELTEPLGEWASSKAGKIYIGTSLLCCILAMAMYSLWAPAFGMEPYTYAIVVGYGGGHAVSKFLGMKNAATVRKFKKEHDGEDQPPSNG